MTGLLSFAARTSDWLGGSCHRRAPHVFYQDRPGVDPTNLGGTDKIMWNEGSAKIQIFRIFGMRTLATEEPSSTNESSALCIGIVEHTVIDVTKM